MTREIDEHLEDLLEEDETPVLALRRTTDALKQQEWLPSEELAHRVANGAALALAQSEVPADVVDVRHRLRLAETLFRQRGAKLQESNPLVAQRLRTEWELGRVLPNVVQEGRPKLSHDGIVLRLSDLGLSLNESSRFQRLARHITDLEDLEACIQDALDKGEELSTAWALRLVDEVSGRTEHYPERYTAAQVAAAVKQAITLPPAAPATEGDEDEGAPDVEPPPLVQAIRQTLEAAAPSVPMKTCDVCGRLWLADLLQCPYCTLTPEQRIEGLRRSLEPIAHVGHNSGENEWYTPPEYLDAARAVMGSIDIDPASAAKANERVKAAVFYDAEQDGLRQPWHGNVWINPPYAQPLIAQFSDAAVDKYAAGEYDQACVLVNNATETAWCQRLIAAASALCFVRGRVRFLTPEDVPGAPLQGQIVLYLGANARAFREHFEQFGHVWVAQ